MATFDQLHSGLTLAYATVTQNQDALAVNFNENTVTGNTGGQLHIQQTDQSTHQGGSGLRRRQNRHRVHPRKVDHLRQGFQTAADEHRRGSKLKQTLQVSATGSCGQLLQIRHLDHTEDLDPIGIEILVVPSKHNARAVDIRRINGDLSQFFRRIDRFKIQLFRYFAQWDGKCRHKEHPSFLMKFQSCFYYT